MILIFLGVLIGGGLTLIYVLQKRSETEARSMKVYNEWLNKELRKDYEKPTYLPSEDDYSEETNEARGMPSSVIQDEEDEETS